MASVTAAVFVCPVSIASSAASCSVSEFLILSAMSTCIALELHVLQTVRHAAASGTLSRDSRPYPNDRYALPLRLISHWKPASPHFRGRLTPEVGDDMEGGKGPALTGITKRNLPRLTSSYPRSEARISNRGVSRRSPVIGAALRKAAAAPRRELREFSLEQVAPGAAQRLGPESRSGPRRCGLSCDGNREGTGGWLAFSQARRLSW